MSANRKDLLCCVVTVAATRRRNLITPATERGLQMRRGTVKSVRSFQRAMLVLTALLATTFCATSASADTIYSSAASTNQLAYPISGTPHMAEDFTLSTANTVGGATFLAWITDGATIGSIDWNIRNDASAYPGAIITSGSTATFSQTFLDDQGTHDRWWVSFLIPELPLSAGTYWLNLHITQTSGSTSWDVAEDDGSHSAHWSISNSELFAISQQLTFSIQGPEAAVVPVPKTAWAGLAMIGALALRKLRRRNVAT